MAKQKDDRYSKSIESGIWYDEATEEHDYAAFFAAFESELSAAPLPGTYGVGDGAETKLKVMRRYGIWFGPQR